MGFKTNTMDILNKFIIEGERIILGKVTHHSELMQTDDKENVIGGGFCLYDSGTNTFILFGSSSEFGKAKIQDIKPVIFSNKVYTDIGITNNEPLSKHEYNFVYRSKHQGDIPLL
jgi:hypothetical protein